MDDPSERTCRELVHTRSLGFCEARIPHVCTGLGQSKHHRDKKGRVWLPSNVLDLCGDGTRGCHGWIEAHPALAHERGLWLRHGEVSQASPAAIWWRGVLDWFYLSDDGGLKWPGYGEGEIPPLVS